VVEVLGFANHIKQNVPKAVEALGTLFIRGKTIHAVANSFNALLILSNPSWMFSIELA
jgi:hypothetical protein